MKAWTRRDLTIVPLGPQDCMVIACDSCGAVGGKKGDVLALSPRYVGKFTARVALTEVLCSGALPVTIVNGVACEMEPTGKEIIAGIQDELKNAGFADIVLTGSTEENFLTSMTALAVTVIGTVKTSNLKFSRAVKGDRLILLGSPKVGSEVELESKGFYGEIHRLLSMPLVREMIPVGSRGVRHEVKALADFGHATVKLYDTEIDYCKSAGPATCLLILCAEAAVDLVMACCQSAALIGEVQENERV